MRLFAPITKVDVEKREVWGRAVWEVPDKAHEIFDYATSAPLFRAWSADFEKATDGKSLGNVRAMHGKVAAGKLIAIDFNDSELAIDIGTKIVDDAEWAKVEEGVYTGFSIGGEYLKRWKDGDLTRYTAQPAEISIVDNPCVPGATFTMIKADGASEARPFTAPVAQVWACGAPGCTHATKADASTHRDTLAKGAAVAGEPVPVVETPPASPAEVPVAEPVQKSMGTVANFASVLQSLAWLAADAEFESQWEGDASPVPAQLRAWIADGAALLLAMTAEEVTELLAAMPTPVAVIEMAAAGDLAKAGARHSKADKNRLQAIHDHAVGMGADCGPADKATGDEMAKALGAMTSARDEALTRITDAEAELAKRATRIVELEQTPLPPKGATSDLIAVSKDEAATRTVASADPIAKLDAEIAATTDMRERALLMVKRVHALGATPLIRR